jgi:hypothetical protein
MKARSGADHAVTIGAMNNYAFALVQDNQLVAAEPLLRECVPLMKKRYPNHWQTFRAKTWLGAALLHHDEYEQAEPHLLQGYEGLREREENIPVDERVCIQTAVKNLVHLYSEWDKPTQAAEWKERLKQDDD